MLPEEIKNIIVNEILATYSPEGIFLYGSYAKGKANDQSDIDICVKMHQGEKVMRFDDELNNRLTAIVNKEVHIVFCTKMNEWCLVQLWGFPKVTAMNKMDRACAIPLQLA